MKFHKKKIKTKIDKFKNNNRLNKNKFPNDKIKSPSNQNFFLWGKHALEAAIINKKRNIIKIYHTNEMCDWINEKLKNSNRSSEKLNEIEKKDLEDHALSSPHQGVMAEVEPLTWLHLEDYVEQNTDNMCLVLLDQLTNSQNIGSILRTASAFNVDGVVITKNNTPMENGLMARAAAGAIETMPLIRVTNLSRSIEYLKKNNFFVIGLEKHGKENISECVGNPQTALVLGSENLGLRRLTKEKLSTSAKIPIAVQTESLNVSNAAAIALYVIQNN